MNKRRQEATNICLTKIRYETLGEAGRIAKLVRRQISRHTIVPYKCLNGEDHYHIGHNYAAYKAVLTIQRRLRLGLIVDQQQMEFAGEPVQRGQSQ